MSLFGTGVIKGPFAIDKEYLTGMMRETTTSSKQFHKFRMYLFGIFIPTQTQTTWMKRSLLLSVMNVAHTASVSVVLYTLKVDYDEGRSLGENYTKKYWEDDLADYAPEHGSDSCEVLEYWGTIDTSMLEDNDVDIRRTKEFDDTRKQTSGFVMTDYCVLF